MIDPTKAEIAAMEQASNMAGEYIEHLGKTDMAQFNEEEWMTLVEVICGAFTDELRKLSESEIPF